jgi:hypothetical protein
MSEIGDIGPIQLKELKNLSGKTSKFKDSQYN